MYSDGFLKHQTGGHPESPDRLLSVLNHLEKRGLYNCLNHSCPPLVERNLLELIHTPDYIKQVENLAGSGRVEYFDADTIISPGSFYAASMASGAVVQAVQNVVSGKWHNAFCAVRPPGHHAENSHAMGFCLFNNVAVGAMYAVEFEQIQRVLILDWDVHHGNGTQNTFFRDSRVFYVSLHEYPHYPGSGSPSETGEGKGKGFTLNIPLCSGLGEKEYVELFEKKVLQQVLEFNPELIFLSAGFDAHKDDPLSSINLSSHGFGVLTDMLMGVADTVCGGKVVSVLEGGYNLRALGESVFEHISVLADLRGLH
ncbi:MAG: histone deacetylase [Nitrospinota bacterium]